MKIQVTYTKLDGTRHTLKGHKSNLERKIQKAQEAYPAHKLNPEYAPIEWDHESLTSESLVLLNPEGKFVLQSEAFHNDVSKSGNGVIYNMTKKDNNGRPFTFANEQDAVRFQEITTQNLKGLYKVAVI